MTDFKIEPYIVVTIRSYHQFRDVPAFLNSVSTQIPPGAPGRVGPMLWSNGVIFGFAAYAPSESLTDEYLKGHLPWDNLDFAPMPNFEAEMRLPGREVVFTARDVSEHSLMGPLGKWIRVHFRLESSTKRRGKVAKG
jgi:hypothetical protein